MPHWPLLRKKQVVVVPIIAIVIGALVMCALIGLTVVNAPVIGMFAVLISATASIIGILFLLFLDRWEPEPPHLLISAFFWGGGVSLLMVFIASPILALVGGEGEFFGATISAPLIEESAKGLFLVLVLLVSRRGRAEFNSLTDALVYAGFVGIGFSFIEDLLYIAGESTLGGALTVAGVRLGLGAWAHSIYTSMTAIGLWLGVTSRGPMRILWPFFGWCVAVLLHAIHNGSTFLGIGAYLLSLLMFSLPAFLAYVLLGVRSYRQEGTILVEQLPVMVHNGWIAPGEANWLAAIRSRKQAIAHARTQGRAERARVAAFRDNATELAFVRHRLNQLGPPYSPELVAHHDELVQLLLTDRQWMGTHLPPPPPAWRQVPAMPGPDYRMPRPGLPFP
jgi:protease PrsW